MKMPLAELCTSELHVRDLVEPLNTLQDDELRELVGREDLSAAFLHALFFCAENVSDEVRKQFARHVNAPDSVVLMCLKYFPGWVEESPAVALRHMNMMGSADTNWDRLVSSYLRDGYNASVYSKQWYFWLPFLKIEPNSTKACWDRPSVIGKGLASRVLTAILDKGYKEDLIDVANHLTADKHVLLVEHAGFRLRLLAIERLTLSDAHIEQLASDQTASVRRKLASIKGLTEKAVNTLLDGNDSAVNAVLAANSHLDRSLQTVVTESREESIEKSDGDASSVQEALAILKDDKLSQTLLIAHARHPEPVVRFATGMHKGAGKEVAELVLADDVEWVKGALAAHTRDLTAMQTLAGSPDPDVIRHLSNNRNLPVELAVQLVKTHPDNEVRLGLAGLHVHDSDFMDALRATRDNPPEWELDLDIALDETTRKAQLSKLHNNAARNELCVSRAIARHKRCPPAYLDKFVFYLPEDALSNPVNVMAALEGQTIHKDWHSDWSIERRIRDRSAHAFMTNGICLNGKHDMQRLAPLCRAVHPVFLDHVALIDDDVVQKRLAERKIATVSRFVVELLACSKRAPVKKLLLKHDDLPTDIVERLCSDDDKSVRLAASRLARKVGVSASHSEPATASSNGSLGNKAARLDLAENSDELQIIERLVDDKLADVRGALLKRTDLSNDMILRLCNDADSQVATDAIDKVREYQLSAAQESTLQSVLIDTLRKAESTRALKGRCITHLADKSLVDGLYLNGELDDLRIQVASHAQSREAIDKLIFDFSREKRGKRDQRILMENPALSLEQARRVMQQSEMHPGDVLHRVSDPQLCLDLVADMDLKDLFDKHDAIIKADFSRDQVQELLAINKNFLRFLPGQTGKLEDDEVLKRLQSLPKHSLKKMCYIPGWQEPVNSWLFTWAYESDDYSNRKSEREGPLEHFVSCQAMTQGQISRVIEHADPEARRYMVSNQAEHISEEAYLLLARDRDVEVRRQIEEASWFTDSFPVSVLRLLVDDVNKEIRSEVRRRMRELGVESRPDRARTTKAISHLLKRNDVAFGAIKANRKLMELGILEECERESTSSPGEIRKYKKLSEHGEAFGVNKFNQYGEASVEYFEDQFPELLKKIA